MALLVRSLAVTRTMSRPPRRKPLAQVDVVHFAVGHELQRLALHVVDVKPALLVRSDHQACGGSAELAQIAGSSAASPALAIGSVSTVGRTVGKVGAIGGRERLRRSGA